MKISLDYPDELDIGVMQVAAKDGHNNRAAAIRKMLVFYLSDLSHFVALNKQGKEPISQTRSRKGKIKHRNSAGVKTSERADR